MTGVVVAGGKTRSEGKLGGGFLAHGGIWVFRGTDRFLPTIFRVFREGCGACGAFLGGAAALNMVDISGVGGAVEAWNRPHRAKRPDRAYVSFTGIYYTILYTFGFAVWEIPILSRAWLIPI
jgi:hypothetical protein